MPFHSIICLIASSYQYMFCRDTVNLEDDVYSVGIILLEMLVGPSISEKGETFFLNELVIYASTS